MAAGISMVTGVLSSLVLNELSVIDFQFLVKEIKTMNNADAG